MFALPGFGERISIHAPPRGATIGYAFGAMPAAFQFTPLREGRPGVLNRRKYQLYFNSRPSARGDIKHRKFSYL